MNSKKLNMKRSNQKQIAQLQRSLDYTNQQIQQSDSNIQMLERAKKRHVDAKEKLEAQIKKLQDPSK